MKLSLTKHQIPWIIFLAGLVAFLFNLSPEFVAFQTRFALFAQEMMHHGIRLFPYTYQGPYPDYPALPTILIYLASLPFGKVTPFAAILPTAVASSLILVFIYKIGEMRSRHMGIYAVLFALLTQSFVDASRSISMDQFTSCITVISFYIVYSAEIYEKLKRLWLLPICLVLGFFLRGPIGLVIPAGVLCGYFLCRHEIKKLFIFALIALALLILLMSVLLAAAYYEHGRLFLHDVLFMEFTGRLGDNAGSQGFFYYWTQGLANYAIAFPIAIVVIISQLKSILRTLKIKNTTANFQFLTYLTAWIFIVLIGMSIPGAKKIRYILPIVPACALISACIFTEFRQSTILAWTRKFFIGICYVLPFLTVIFSCVALLLGRRFNLHLSFYPVIVFSTLLCFVLIWLEFMIKSDMLKQFSIIFIAVLALLTINIGILEPINYALERTKPFVEKIQKLEQQKALPIVFYKIGPDGEDIKFMVNWPTPFDPTFIQGSKKLFSYTKKAYFIALQKDFLQLPKTKRIIVLDHGKIGHRKVVIFTINQPIN